MKSIILLMALLILPLFAEAVFGQEPGDIGVFFDAGGIQTGGSIVVGIPFYLYVVAFDIPIGILSHEGSIQRDPSHVLLSNQFNPPSSFNVGTPENWIVGTGGCLPIFGPTVLQTLQYVSFAASLDDQIFSIGPATPSSFSPAAAGYVDCADNHRPFGLAASGNGLYPDGCAVGNPTEMPPVSTEQQRWGEVKALFR